MSVKLESQLVGEWTDKNSVNCVSAFFTNNTNWRDFRTEILAPNHCLHKVNNGSYLIEWETTVTRSEFSLLVLYTTIVMLGLLACMNMRSWNPYSVDWFRLMTMYLLGTLSFIFFFQIGPSTPGFARITGFGVLIHNAAEVYVIKYIWCGRQGRGLLLIILGVIYIWFMATCIAFVPINTLYFVAMLQGSWMDWVLVFSFPLISYKINRKWNRCSWILGTVAAVMHILSIQPLFFGLGLGQSSLYAATSIFLFPTFFFYTFFAARDLGRISFVGPSFNQTLNYQIKIKGEEDFRDEELFLLADTTKKMENRLNKKITSLNLHLENHNSNTNNTTNNNTSNKSNDNSLKVTDDDNSNTSTAPHFTRHRAKTNAAETGVDLRDQTDKFFDGMTDEDANYALKLSKVGALQFFWNPKGITEDCGLFDSKYKSFWILILGSLFVALMNSFLVWFAPCWIHPDCSK